MRDLAPRLLILGLGAALLVWAFDEGAGSAQRPVRAAPAPEPPPQLEPAPQPAPDYAADYRAFVEALGAFRAGDDAALPELQAAATKLEQLHGRDDAPEVCGYYASLTGAQRAQGLADYGRFVELWEGVQDADAEDWPERRRAHLSELRAFVAECTASADFVPAGRALSLAAQIEVRALEAGMPVLEREDTSEAAERDAREALAIFERAGMETPRLEPLWLLAKLADLRSETAEADELYDEVLEIARACRVDDYRERALLGLVRLARESGDVHRVQVLLAELASFRDPADCWPLAREHASRLLHRDEPRRAAEFLLRVRPFDEDQRESWTLLLALTRWRTGETAAARVMIDRLGDSGADEDRLAVEARITLSEGKPTKVLELLSPEVLASLSPPTLQFAHTLRGEAQLDLKRPSLALAELATARAMATSWEVRLERQRALEGTSASVFGEWLGLHASSLEARALAAEGRALEAALVMEQAQSPTWRGAASTAASPAHLEAWAAHYEHGLVTWIFGADVGLAVHVDRQGQATAHEIQRSRRELHRAVRRFREALLRGDAALTTQLSRDLVETLIPPALLERLEQSTPDQRLLCVGHGAVEVLPFEALAWGGRSMDERASLLVLPELPELHPGSASEVALSWSLLGDPLAQDGSARLPAAGRELDEIQALWSESTRSSGAEFTREACLAALAEAPALHVSTHLTSDTDCDAGRFSPVGLELSGGEVLCAADLAAQPVLAQLIVLSVCDTSGGRFLDARGRQGIARALLDGGARDLLMTLWPVTDEAAWEFTPRFHAALSEGLQPSLAARRARSELAASGAKPADWAAFRIAGRD